MTKVIAGRELTLGDLATILGDIQGDLRLILLNQDEILTKIDNINTYGPSYGETDEGEYA